MAFFDKISDASWHLAQKSETLMYDQRKESEEKQSETFIWKKKNQKTGMDKLEPEKMMVLNKLKQEETSVNFEISTQLLRLLQEFIEFLARIGKIEAPKD